MSPEQTEQESSQAPTIVISNSNSEGNENEHSNAAEEQSGVMVEEPNNSGNAEGASVEIARIEAERDVALAALGHDTQVQQIEADKEIAEAAIEKETNLELELAECRDQISALKQRVEEMENTLIQPPLEETLQLTEELPIAEETNLTPQSTVEDLIETVVSDANADAEQVVEKPVKKLVRI